MEVTVLLIIMKCYGKISTLTLDAVQVCGGQHLSLALVRGNALVLGLLGTRHVACASTLLQVVAATGG